MNEKQKRIEEVKEIIAPQRIAVFESKYVEINKTTGQFSVKIPKSLAERAGFNKKTVAHIVFRPNQGTLGEAIKSDMLIYFDEVIQDEKGKKKSLKG